MIYAELLHGIQVSIKAELNDCEFYTNLAQFAPDDEAKNIILGIAKNEKEHARLLKDAYCQLTGRAPQIVEFEKYNIVDYKQALKKKILDETSDSEKYREYFLSTKLEWLRDIFFRAMHDENRHAIRLLTLIGEMNT